MPAVIVELGPQPGTQRDDIGATTAIAPAAGSVARPPESGVAELELQELGQHEQGAEEPEHDQADRTIAPEKLGRRKSAG